MKLWLFYLLITVCSGEQVCLWTAGRSGMDPECFDASDVLTPHDVSTLEQMRKSPVVDVKNATGLHVRHSTLLLTLESGLVMKCKNEKKVRYGMDALANEVHAFYFDRMMRVGSVPPASVVDFSGRRWKAVRKHPLLKGNWRRGDILACSEWLDDVDNAILPQVFRNSTEELTVALGERVGWTDATKRQVEEWSRMLAFDFLACINDRFPPSVSSGRSFREKKNRPPGTTTYNHCNRDDPKCAVHNLFVRKGGDSHLIFVDNNSAFFYDKNGSPEHLEWVLRDTCVFPKAFVERVRELGSQNKGPILQLTALETAYDKNIAVLQWNRQNVLNANFEKLNLYFNECAEKTGSDRLWFFD